MRIYLEIGSNLQRLLERYWSRRDEQHQELMNAIKVVSKQDKERDMATQQDIDELLLTATESTDALKALAAAVDVLNEENVSLEELIDALKAANPAVDVGPLKAKLTENKQVVASLQAAVIKGTVLDPSNMGGATA